MPLLSLRLVISVVSALLVTVVAAAALTVLLTTSTASLRDVGRKHATGLIDTVQYRTVALFEPSFVALDMFSNFSRTQYWDFPSNDRRVADKYYDRAESVYQMLELKAPGVLVYFWDNTRVSMNPYNSTHYQRYLIVGSPENATGGLESQVLTSAGTLVDHTNNFKESFLSFNPNSEGNRLIGTSTEQLLLTITASGRQASIAGIFDRSDRSGVVESYVTMAAPLYRQGDAATRDNLYGMVLTSLFIEDINNFLADSRSTPNTEAFAADIFGYLYGSSLVDRPPGRERGGTGATITPIATLLGSAPQPVDGESAADGNDDEWLYVVNNNETGDVNALWNEAISKLSFGDVKSAIALADEYREKTNPSPSTTNPHDDGEDTLQQSTPGTAVSIGATEAVEQPTAPDAGRSVFASAADWRRFDALSRITDAAHRFRDLGDFYTAAYSV